uniref:Uncharacterized protein n=1 Tax=Molossus molossus TaxID=27622 RepID=A0A7J8DTG6_MOLMO|nr:hypothetical protein HJG59_009119 [Molossus molossus]
MVETSSLCSLILGEYSFGPKDLASEQHSLQFCTWTCRCSLLTTAKFSNIILVNSDEASIILQRFWTQSFHFLQRFSVDKGPIFLSTFNNIFGSVDIVFYHMPCNTSEQMFISIPTNLTHSSPILSSVALSKVWDTSC